MKYPLLSLLALFLPFASSSAENHHDWEDNHVLQINREPAKDFYRTDFDASSWKTLAVPANWEVNGYGTPIYISAGYPFKIDPPYVMKEPKKEWTTYVERNPTGQYRRTFTLPAEWKEGQTFLRFEGVMSAFYVWINMASKWVIVRALWNLLSSTSPPISRKERIR